MTSPSKSLYRKPILLDRERHRRMRLRTGQGFGFAAGLNAMYITGAEFGEACKEYPLVFVRTPEGGVEPAAMLGLREGENLFVDPQGRWGGRYVPAFVRRYPFVLAQLPGQTQLGVCVDDAAQASGEQPGEALFDAQGEPTPYLQQSIQFLEQFQREHQRTRAFCQNLHEADLLRPMNARADLPDGRAFTVDGLLVVDEKKLLALPDAQVLSFFRGGELHLLSMHLLSLSNLKALTQRMTGQTVPAAPAARSVQ